MDDYWANWVLGAKFNFKERGYWLAGRTNCSDDDDVDDRVGHAVAEYAPNISTYAPKIAEHAIHADDGHRQLYPYGQP